jgi:hypothetical protein
MLVTAARALRLRRTRKQLCTLESVLLRVKEELDYVQERYCRQIAGRKAENKQIENRSGTTVSKIMTPSAGE